MVTIKMILDNAQNIGFSKWLHNCHLIVINGWLQY